MPFIEIDIAEEINTRCLNQAKALVVSLSNLDPRGFEAAFGSLLANFPYQIHLPYVADNWTLEETVYGPRLVLRVGGRP
jgi:hypothetical protein